MMTDDDLMSKKQKRSLKIGINAITVLVIVMGCLAYYGVYLFATQQESLMTESILFHVVEDYFGESSDYSELDKEVEQ